MERLKKYLGLRVPARIEVAKDKDSLTSMHSDTFLAHVIGSRGAYLRFGVTFEADGKHYTTITEGSRPRGDSETRLNYDVTFSQGTWSVRSKPATVIITPQDPTNVPMDISSCCEYLHALSHRVPIKQYLQNITQQDLDRNHLPPHERFTALNEAVVHSTVLVSFEELGLLTPEQSDQIVSVYRSPRYRRVKEFVDRERREGARKVFCDYIVGKIPSDR